MVVYTFNQKADLWEFKASLVYKELVLGQPELLQINPASGGKKGGVIQKY